MITETKRRSVVFDPMKARELNPLLRERKRVDLLAAEALLGPMQSEGVGNLSAHQCATAKGIIHQYQSSERNMENYEGEIGTEMAERERELERERVR